MSTRYELREYEQQRFLEESFRIVRDRIEEQAVEYDWAIHHIARAVLELLPDFREIIRFVVGKPIHEVTRAAIVSAVYERTLVGTITAYVQPARIIVSNLSLALCGFSRTPEEAEYLLWRFFIELNGSLDSRFARDYQHQKMHDQKKTLGGGGMDEVPAEEEQKRLAEIECFRQLYVQ
jgi:hypothetical protein